MPSPEYAMDCEHERPRVILHFSQKVRTDFHTRIYYVFENLKKKVIRIALRILKYTTVEVHV